MRKNFYLSVLILLITAETYPQWVPTSAPLDGHVTAITVNDTNIFAGIGINEFDCSVYRSTNNGTNWTEVNTGLPLNIRINDFAIIGTNLFTATTEGVFHTINYGESWDGTGLILSQNNEVIALVAFGTNLFAGTWDGVYLSTDEGINWLKTDSTFNHYIYDFGIIFNGASSSYLFVSTFALGIFLSNDNGANWTAVNTGLPLTGSINSLPVIGNNIFAGGLDGIFLSTDYGTSWSAVNSGIPENTIVYSLMAIGKNLFSATNTYSDSNRVFVSINNGTSWGLFNSGLPSDNPVYCFTANDSNIFAGTNGSGVWRRSLSEIITDVQSSFELPINFKLEQNYPNPFNPSTKIKYSIPGVETRHSDKSGQVTSSVQLKVYDVLGIEIAILVKEEKPAGNYEIEFDAGNHSSGVYFYQLKAGDFVETKKMILLQ